MKQLTITECRFFIKYFAEKISNVGLMQILKDFSANNPGSLGDAVQSWYNNMVDGQSIPDSIRKTNPKFARPVEELIAISAAKNILDYALTDMCSIYDREKNEDEIITQIGLLIDKYRNRTDSGIICDACFNRDFNKVIMRAGIEEAFEVIFEQEKEIFFHQKYIGVKTIHYIEPCNSKVYKSFLKKLNDCIACNESLLVDNNKFTVERDIPGKFKISNSAINLLINFK